MSTAAETWPQANEQLTERALAGKLTAQERQRAEWLGFELPTYTPRKDYGLRMPSPPPVTTAADLAYLVAGGYGPATSAQVFELPADNQVRKACDNPDRSYTLKHYVLWAAGRGWSLFGHPFSKYATLGERTAANAARRVVLEQQRAQKATEAARAKAAAAKQKLGPLGELFYGPIAEVVPAVPRYETPADANAHALDHRQDWLNHMRSAWARGIREVRRRLAEQNEATVAIWFTEWQRRGYGDYAYLLDFMWQKTKLVAPDG